MPAAVIYVRQVGVSISGLHCTCESHRDLKFHRRKIWVELSSTLHLGTFVWTSVCVENSLFFLSCHSSSSYSTGLHGLGAIFKSVQQYDVEPEQQFWLNS